MRRGQNKGWGEGSGEFLLNLINGWGQNKWERGGRNFKKSANIGNESKKKQKCLILMLKLQVSKQIRSEANKNKVSTNQKNIKHISKLSKCK